MLWIVTVKNDRNPAHDPHNKITASCSVSSMCTDSTGAHHSFIVETNGTTTPNDIRASLHPRHVTRIEEAMIISWRN